MFSREPDLKQETHKPQIKPRALRPGDIVGIIAPASPIEAALLESGCVRLRKLGYEPVYFESILDRDTYFAGSVERRVRELQSMFLRDDVRAIICARGGYGCNCLLPEIDLDIVRAHPKIFVGYSDVSTLLTYLSDETGLVTFHGPMVTKDFANAEGVNIASWKAVIEGAERRSHSVATRMEHPQSEGLGSTSAVPLVRGYAQGRIYGGCLSMLVASMGTPYEIQTDGAILFIEDIGAYPYQVDRMLMQLKLGGKLDGVHGIIFGEMPGCDPAPECGYSLQDVVSRVVGDLGVPVAFGYPSGHVAGNNQVLPIGVQAILKVQDEVRLGWEPAVSTATQPSEDVFSRHLSQ